MTANLSQPQKDFMISIAETSLNDLCTIRRKTSETKSPYNDILPAYTDEENVPCGISYGTATYKNEVNQVVILETEVILRLKLSEEIDTDDLVIARDVTYTVDGIDKGLTLKIVSLKRLEA